MAQSVPRRAGFGPVYTPASRLLILGSYPSPQSFAGGFYYGHPQNRFWPLLAALLGQAPPASVAAKTALIQNHRLALWDALESCDIQGASDASIQNPVPNHIPGLLAKTQIQAVVCNGAAAHRYYERYARPHTGLAATRLPSTSPANAAWSFERLKEAWGIILEKIE